MQLTYNLSCVQPSGKIYLIKAIFTVNELKSENGARLSIFSSWKKFTEKQIKKTCLVVEIRWGCFVHMGMDFPTTALAVTLLYLDYAASCIAATNTKHLMFSVTRHGIHPNKLQPTPVFKGYTAGYRMSLSQLHTLLPPPHSMNAPTLASSRTPAKKEQHPPFSQFLIFFSVLPKQGYLFPSFTPNEHNRD